MNALFTYWENNEMKVTPKITTLTKQLYFLRTSLYSIFLDSLPVDKFGTLYNDAGLITGENASATG